MALLNRLLDAAVDERDAELATLQRTEPALHLRVQQLLAANDSGTQALAAPLVAGLQAATQAGWREGMHIAAYRLLRALGQGGMSSVWLAERADGQLKRQVAIKLPLAAHLSGVLAERFSRERDVLAALDHPHIARLIDAGVGESGQPYIVLEYVAGVAITEYATQLSLPQKLALFLQVLAAVEHAHRHMTVHRDLKPSNILVDAQGQIKLLDFGIAKLLAPPPGAAALTQDAGSVLTPRYAAPEQVLGGAVTTATDVYSAGMVLYELLTGRLAYGPGYDSVAQLMHAVAQVEAQPPGLATDIDTVLLKALRKAPAERYASIERFAEDVRRLLANEPILARRVPGWQRLLLLVRRRRAASLAAASAVLMLAAAAGVAWQQNRESTAQRERAEKVREFVFNMVSDAEPNQGSGEVTGLEMIDAAVTRAQREFAADPRLHGELLAELGRVYFRLQRPEKSITTLDEALRLLAHEARADDAAINRTRAVLAQSLIGRDNGRARTLADQALAACTRSGPDCAEVRARSHYALSILSNWLGHSAPSLAHARAMVRESELAYGTVHEDIGPALATLAASARNHGELMEAAQAVRRAQAVAAGRTLKSDYRTRLDLLQAVLEVDMGQYSAAREHLQALLGTPTGDIERGIQWRWMSMAELGLGRPQAALAAAEQALRLGPANAIGWLARQQWGEVASRLGRHDEALTALAAAQAGIEQAGTSAQSERALRGRRLMAEALLRQERDAEAAAALRALVSEHAALDTPLRVESALVMDALACAAAKQGQGGEARKGHAAAMIGYAATLPATHAYRLRSAALLEFVDGDAARALLAWQASLAADSPWRQNPPRDCRGLL